MNSTSHYVSSTDASCPDSRWPILGWIILFLGVTGLLQLYIPYPIADDTAYHFAVGQLIGKYGILHSFPWTPFSWQFDHYADKEFLFHLLFVPLGGLGLVDASRVVGIICGTLILTTLYLVLRAERVRLAGIWALLPLGMSTFAYRFVQVRPHLLSIALALVIAWAYARDRRRILALAAVIYPLAYVAFWQIPLIIIVAVESARLLAGERARWKPAITVLVGLAVGVALHPNARNLLAINWIHMVDVLVQNAWGRKVEFDMAREFNPYAPYEWGMYLVVSVFMTGSAAVIAWRGRKGSSVPLALSLAALLFCLLTVKSGRFTEYFIPFSVLAFAVATRTSGAMFSAPVLAVISLLYTLAFSIPIYQVMGSLAARETYLDPTSAADFRQQIPPGSRVYTCSWDYTGMLMVALPERIFMVAADPTLFYKKDPQLYEFWARLHFDAPPDSAEIIRRQFNCRFAICPRVPVLEEFFNAIYEDPAVKTTVTDKWVLFDLGASPE